MKMIYKRIGAKPEVIESEGDLADLQSKVGGYIECLDYSYLLQNKMKIEKEFDLILNEEGKLMGLEPNIVLRNDECRVVDIVVGDIVLVGVDEEEGDFCDFPEEYVDEVMEILEIDEYPR